MWDHLPISNLLTLQRQAKVNRMDQQIHRLYTDGYVVDADRLLDERIEYVNDCVSQRGRGERNG